MTDLAAVQRSLDSISEHLTELEQRLLPLEAAHHHQAQHEAICGERYGKINGDLARLETEIREIKDIIKAAAVGIIGLACTSFVGVVGWLAIVVAKG
jgi:hypothetical protein